MKTILSGIQRILFYKITLHDILSFLSFSGRSMLLRLSVLSVVVALTVPVAVRHYKNAELNRQRIENYHALIYDLLVRSKKFTGDVGICIRDLKTGQEVNINADMLFPSASLVKVPIMAAVFQAEQEGWLLLSDEIKLERQHKVHSRAGLYRRRTGKKFTVLDLVERMIITSDNTATNMLVDTLGFGYLNQKFLEFGLKETDMRRGIMELQWRKLGIDNYTTPKEMAYLLEKIYKGDLVNKEASRHMLEILKQQKINDRIPHLLPENTDVAHKTGTLRDTISDVGIVFTQQGDFVICVLTQNIKSRRVAKRFIRDVAADAYKFY